MSLSYKSITSPSVVSKFSSVTVVTRACPLPWFHLLQHVNVKRDSVYCKTWQWKYCWLQNATRYVISKWCLFPCYQESIIDCKTWFDSFGRILGTGVPFAYASNVKANSGCSPKRRRLTRISSPDLESPNRHFIDAGDSRYRILRQNLSISLKEHLGRS